MRRITIVLLTLTCFTTIASAQNPVTVNLSPAPGGSALVVSLASAKDVVARMMSFDSDRDGRVAASELPERMQALVARGDASGDGALDNEEVFKLASTIRAQEGGGFVKSGGYTFGDQVGLSSRAHIEGALEDLRLPSATREQALDAARWFMDGLETDATADLLNDLKPLLTTEQLAAFRTALAKGGTAVAGFSVALPQNGAVRTVVMQSAMDVQVARLSLSPAQRVQAMASIERFRSRLRPGDEERAALLEEMKGILSAEERDNFRAALERRPMVKSGAMPIGRTLVSPIHLRTDVVAPPPQAPDPSR
jgi:hypothetical protein